MPYLSYQVTLYLFFICNKLLKRVVYVHWFQFYSSCFLLNPVQLGIFHCHCIETTLEKVTNDLHIAKFQVNFSIFISLDLAAAFDWIDHSLLHTPFSLGFQAIIWRRHWQAVSATLWPRQDKFTRTTESFGGKGTAQPLLQEESALTLAWTGFYWLICIGIQGVYGKLINHCQAVII